MNRRSNAHIKNRIMEEQSVALDRSSDREF